MNCIQTKTGDIMHVGECTENEVTYGMITITLKKAFTQLQDAEMALKQFLHQLQPIFAIQHATGIDISWNSGMSRRLLIDYWQDGEQKDWKIQGRTDGASIQVLYIKNITRVPVAVEEYFFSTSVFPVR